ncbi:uncharacterized protein At4g38062 isoform X1 [Quercus lobata]|uniref:Uncharacterized protein n=1 Tax=Quercus lobata TaxID=97700 RepID=A0A7N2LZZ7_QUELO|nr:uncharacterized protein At4g38062 isoform X1 [Quercus lobata]XP_030975537.1 uncharacterized protein At4g38062 isoform X1 [Quercus lobata]
MDRAYEELHDAKAEIEKLKAEYKSKAELCENLKKTHNEQLIKLQEASLKIEKQSQELNDKTQEISEVKQMCEELKCSFNEKEFIIKRLSAANDKHRADYDEKCLKWEKENRDLMLALDEANEKIMDQEQSIRAHKEEIEGLKGCLSVSQKKCSEAEKRAKASKELSVRDDMLLNLEDENRKLKDQLKWKKEHFAHLEEAHEKLRNQFRASKKEWEQEKSSLFDEICSLQTSLDSQTRISEDLKNKLKMCNQALAHEESRRKYLEVQVSEFQTRFENAFTECQDAKSLLDCLTTDRDNEISALRHSLGTKETIYKEMKYQARKLEQENKELRISLRELQEAQIQESGASSSLAKLRNKLKSLEQMHRECTPNLRAKEAELSSQLEKLGAELNDCQSELENKDAAINELRMEFETCQSLAMQLKLENEELKLGIYEAQLEKLGAELNDCRSELENKDAAIKELMMEFEGCQSLAMQLKLENQELKLGISEAQLKLANEKAKMDVRDKEREESISLLMKQLEMTNAALSEAQLKLAKEKAELIVGDKEREDNVSLLMKQLEMKNAALVRAQIDIREEREKAESLLRKVESLEVIEEQQLLMQKELESYREMKNTALVRAQTDIIEERKKAELLLRRVESLEFIEEQQLIMQKELERYREMLEESSRCQLLLKEQVLQIESSSKEKLTEVCDALERANTELAEKICEENEIEFELQIWKSKAEHLKGELEENHEVRKELEASLLAQIDVGETIKQEKNGLVQMLEEKDVRMDNLQQQILLQEQELKKREAEAASFAGMETAMSFESEKTSFFQTMTEKDKILEQLEKEVGWLEQESLRRELESAILSQIVAERTFEHEKEKIIHLLDEKNQRIDDLMQFVKSLEQKFNGSLVSFSSQLAEKQAEINLVHEAWERIAAAEILALLEVEEKKLMVEELEDDIRNIQQKLELQERSLCHSRQQALEIEAELDAKQLEMKNLTTQMETKLQTSDAFINELKSEKRSLLEDVMKLSSDRENLLGFIAGLSDRISELSAADSQMMGVLSNLVHSFDNNSSGMVLKEDDELLQSVKENLNIQSSPSTKKYEAISDARPPFRERNN